MATPIKNETKSYQDGLAWTIRVLQIIEEFQLKTRVGKFNEFILQGDNNKFYNMADMDSSFIMAIKLPITKSDLKHGENFEGSALEAFLDIKEIRSNPVTEVINLEQHGEKMIAERYKITKKIDELSFKLIDKEPSDIYRFNRTGSLSVFELDKEEITLFIKFDPIFMILDNASWKFTLNNTPGGKQHPLFFKENYLDIKNFSFFNKHSGGDDLKVLIMYCLHTLLLLSKHHDLGLNGSFSNLVHFKQSAGHNITLSNIDSVVCDHDINLTKDIFKVILLSPIEQQFTINAIANNINPIDPQTYSRFLFQEGKEVRAISAFDILPQEEQVSNIIELKKKVPHDTKMRIMRSTLFLQKETVETRANDYQELVSTYHTSLDNIIQEFKDLWDKIMLRSNKYSKIGFVSKIYLALLFIKKYMHPHFQYHYYTLIGNDNNKVPELFRSIEYNWGIDTELFFDIPEYTKYFTDICKVNAKVTILDLYSGRLLDHGDLSSSGTQRELFFPNPAVLETSAKSNTSYNWKQQVYIIIEDSYTKQAWKKNVKNYIKQWIPKSKGNTKVIILSTENKLETLVLKRVLQDRPMVRQYSQFMANIPKVKRIKKIKQIKILKLNGYTATNIHKRKTWSDAGPASDIRTENRVFVAYSVRQGFAFNGKYYNAMSYATSLKDWSDLLKSIYNKDIVFVSEVDIPILKKNHPDMIMMDSFMGSEEFHSKSSQIINRKIFLKDISELQTMIGLIDFLKKNFLTEVYNENKTRSNIAQHFMYKFIELFPDDEVINVYWKLLTYFPQNTPSYRFQPWNFSSFLEVIPDKNSFDYDIYKKMLSQREVVFSKEEIKASELAMHIFISKFPRQETHALKYHLDARQTLLQKSNYLNLNKETEELLMDSQNNLYMLDFIKLITI